MTDSSPAASIASRVLRRLLDTACGCAARAWRVDVSRTIGGLTVRAEVRSD
jgi:hypothetical protein